MLADLYIHRLSNGMKIAVQKNNLAVKFGTQVWSLLKKRRHGGLKSSVSTLSLELIYRWPH